MRLYKLKFSLILRILFLEVETLIRVSTSLFIDYFLTTFQNFSLSSVYKSNTPVFHRTSDSSKNQVASLFPLLQQLHLILDLKGTYKTITFEKNV